MNGVWLDELGASTTMPVAKLQMNPLHGHHPLTLGQFTCAHGVNAGVLRTWTLPIPAGSTQFLVLVGMNSTSNANSQARVTLSTDGEVTEKSSLLTPHDAPALLAVDLAGKNSLRIAAENVGKGQGPDDVVFGGAVFLGYSRPFATTHVADTPPLTGAVDPAYLSEWPQWRGPLRNGVAVNCPRLADQWASSGPKKLWQTNNIHLPGDGGADCGSPVVADNLVYLHLSYSSKHQVVCVDTANGRKKWEVVFPSDANDWPMHGGASTPLLVGRQLVIQCGHLARCIDATNGRLLWQYDTKNESSSSFGAVNGIGIINAGNTLGFDLATGQSVWSAQSVGGDGGAYGSTAFWTCEEKLYAICVGFNRFCCIDPQNGNVLWSIPGNVGRGDYAQTPAISGNRAVVWFKGKLAVYHLSIQGPTLLWDTPFEDKYSSPILKDDRIYYIDTHTPKERAHACCRNMDTGQLIWQIDIGDPQYSSPILADNKLIFLTDIGHNLHIIDSITGRRLGLFHVNGKSWASPAIVNGLLYVRLADDELSCFDLREQQGHVFPELPGMLTAEYSYNHNDGRSDSVEALFDRKVPTRSNDGSVSRWTWWAHRGTNEWVQYLYTAPREVDGVGVYWFADHTVCPAPSTDPNGGGCEIPESWQIQYLDQGKWLPVETTYTYSLAADRFNWVHFKPVTTMALRLQAKLQPTYCAGILQWTVRPSLPSTTSNTDPHEAYFTSTHAESVDAGWCCSRDDSSFAGGALTIGNTAFTQGIGCHAPTMLTYSLGHDWRWLTFYTGVAAEIKDTGSVVVQVWLDGKQVCETPILRAHEVPVYVSLPIAGARELRIVCNGAGDGFTADHVNLCNLRLSNAIEAPKPDGPTMLPVAAFSKVIAIADQKRESMRGQWHIEGTEIIQSDSNGHDLRLDFGDPNWTDYEFTVDAMKNDGSEGFQVLFRVNDATDFYSANFARSGNTQQTFERARSAEGGRQHPVGASIPGSIDSNRWYRIKVRCEGRQFQAWLDGQKVLDFTDDDKTQLRGGVGLGAWEAKVRFRNLKVTTLDGRILFQGLP